MPITELREVTKMKDLAINKPVFAVFAGDEVQEFFEDYYEALTYAEENAQYGHQAVCQLLKLNDFAENDNAQIPEEDISPHESE